MDIIVNITCTGQEEATTTILANALLFNWIIIAIYNNYWEVVKVIKREMKFLCRYSVLQFLKTTRKLKVKISSFWALRFDQRQDHVV